MPAKSPRAFILTACACAIFWPGSFIFGLPGVLRQHWQQVFDAGAGFAYLIMPHLAGLWLWAALAAIIGFAFGTLFAVSGPLACDCFGMAHFGAIFGLIFTAYGFVSGPLGPWLSGHILDVTRANYTLVFSYLGFMYLGPAGLILLVQPWRECRM